MIKLLKVFRIHFLLLIYDYKQVAMPLKKSLSKAKQPALEIGQRESQGVVYPPPKVTALPSTSQTMPPASIALATQAPIIDTLDACVPPDVMQGNT